MNDFLQFVIRHWLLVSLFVLLFILVIIEEARAKGIGSATSLTPQKLTHLINREEAIIFDMRDSNAFKDGHIVKAVNIQHDIEKSGQKLKKYQQQPVVVVDANGQKAMSMVNKLRKAGFAKVYLLSGGMTSWKTAGLPVVKK